MAARGPPQHDSSDEYASADEGDDEEFRAAQALAKQDNAGDDEFWEDPEEDGEQIVVVPTTLTPEDAVTGVDLFFNNRFEEAERFFEQGKDSIPVFALGYGTISFIKALMTFEGQDVKTAISRLHHCEKLASKFVGGDGMVKGIGKKLLFMRSKQVTPEQLSARIVVSEARLTSALLHPMEETLSGLVKAGMGVRRAWKGFSQCSEHITGKKPVGISESDRGGIQFGLGSFNLVIALLPPRVLKMVEMLGFAGDKDVGLDQLAQCYNGGGLRWPIAALLMLGYHALLPSFFSIPQELDNHIREATSILNRCQAKYPDGCLFMFIAGRLERLKGDVTAAIRWFQRSAAAQREWVQLQHICSYELGWCHMYCLDWQAACAEWTRLLKENQWSKAFFAYMLGVSNVMCGRLPEAAAAFKEVAGHVKRKIGGKVVSVEQYVIRKVADNHWDTVEGLSTPEAALCGHELIYLWNGFSVIREPTLLRILDDIDKAASINPGAMSADTEALCRLMRGTLYKYLGRQGEAEQQFRRIIEELDPVLQHDVFAAPHAMYELGVMLLTPDRIAEAATVLKQATKYSRDYNFEMRLRFRLHSATRLVHQIQAK